MGVTLMTVAPGVEGVDGVEGLLLEPVVPLHPLKKATPRRTSDFGVRRMADTPLNRSSLTPIFDYAGPRGYWTEG